MKANALQQAVGLAVFVAATFAVAAVGGMVTAPNIPGWYTQLAKPSWTPPGWIFGPVWTCLYLMMAVSGWLVWRQHGFAGSARPSPDHDSDRSPAENRRGGPAIGIKGCLVLFAVQLALNCLWSILFFGLHRPRAAFVDILLLWAAIAATLVCFWLRSRWAGLLLIPYLAWVSFAAVLNLAIWRMNV